MPETDGEELFLAIVDETPIADLRAHFRVRPQDREWVSEMKMVDETVQRLCADDV